MSTCFATYESLLRGFARTCGGAKDATKLRFAGTPQAQISREMEEAAGGVDAWVTGRGKRPAGAASPRSGDATVPPVLMQVVSLLQAHKLPLFYIMM